METLNQIMPDKWIEYAQNATDDVVARALNTTNAGVREFAVFLSSCAEKFLPQIAVKARRLTLLKFGKTINLYAPLYISNYCPGGCAYCGFAADRHQLRKILTDEEFDAELATLKALGINDLLLLTGERTSECDFDFLSFHVKKASQHIPAVSVESFSMTTDEYTVLRKNGCIGVTLYQETYDRSVYEKMHRWGPKRDFIKRLETPEYALTAGMRFFGMGVLLGLSDPISDAISLFLHLQLLRKKYWQTEFSISFPRIRPEAGGFQPPFKIDDKFLARLIFAFRICMPDITLVLSTRESPSFRNKMAGLGINRMSVASKTTVGGYSSETSPSGGQFDIYDTRNVEEFCKDMEKLGMEPVFKNWDNHLSILS